MTRQDLSFLIFLHLFSDFFATYSSEQRRGRRTAIARAAEPDVKAGTGGGGLTGKRSTNTGEPGQKQLPPGMSRTGIT